MQLPLQLSFRDIDSSPAVAEHVRHRAERLDTHFARITGCRVVLEGSRHVRPQHEKRYHVRIDLTVPNAELLAGSHPAEAVHLDLHAAIDDAFNEAERMLEDYKHRARWDVKRHEGTPHGRVIKLFGWEGYGFLETHDGREVYFHRNSVLHDRFDKLEIGSMVRFAEEDGDRGPQASTVEVTGRSRRHERAHHDDDHERPTLV